MQAEMSDTSREFSLDRRNFGAKKQKHKLLLQKQWLNLCIQVQLPRGLFATGWYTAKPRDKAS